ncbi:hypothetical protein EON65_42945 [archaeon]|nr:MAG: hypothetical protein EON65_42945 [archaeon]
MPSRKRSLNLAQKYIPGQKKSRESKNTEVSKPDVGLGELYCSPGNPEQQLDLLVVGHNPGATSFSQGHYYANPTNHMWPLLRQAGIVPGHYTYRDDIHCPAQCKVGFTSLMVGVSVTQSTSIPDRTVRSYKQPFYNSLVRHCARVSQNTTSNQPTPPKIIAFEGKRQWKLLFPPSYKTSNTSWGVWGIQIDRPMDWPVELKSSIVYLLPSSSGAAVMKKEERSMPYMQLGEMLKALRDD